MTPIIPQTGTRDIITEAADKAVSAAMRRMRETYPEFGEAVLVGSVAALTRFVMQALPPDAGPFQAIALVNPIMGHVGQQIALARQEQEIET